MRIPRTWALGLVVALVLGLVPASAGAAELQLDASFGPDGSGIVTHAVGQDNKLFDVTLVDGAIYATGYVHADGVDKIAVARFGQDGSSDSSFGTDGVVTTAIGGGARGYAITVVPGEQPRLVVAGEGMDGNDLAVAVYHLDGSPDTAFGGNGWVTTDLGSTVDVANDVAVQPDRKIIVAGRSAGTSDEEDFVVARYLPDGSLDPDFGDGGVVRTDFEGRDEAHALVLGGHGTITVAGEANRTGTPRFAVARYTSSGALDPTFDSDGRTTLAVAGHSHRALAMSQGPHGLILAGRTVRPDGQGVMTLARLTGSGDPDPLFGPGDTGMVTTSVRERFDEARAVVVQPDGRIVAVGRSHDDTRSAFAALRLMPDGSRDPSFGENGAVVTQIGSGFDTANGVALQPDGKTIAAGQTYLGDHNRMALVRYRALREADLTVAKGGPASALVGDDLEYTLTVTNPGPDPAADVALTDTLPAHVAFDSLGGEDSAACTRDGQMVRCGWDRLEVGETRTVHIRVAALRAGTVTNNATVGATTADPQVANNAASAVTQVRNEGDDGPVDPPTESVEEPTEPTGPGEPGEPPPGSRLPAACPPEEVPPHAFTDVDGNTHEPAIACLVWYGVTEGISPTEYGPALDVTRAQMASFIARTIDVSDVALPEPADQGFTDIDGNVHADHINQLAELDVVFGLTDDHYGPDEIVTRAQMASFLVRGYDLVSDESLAASRDHFGDDDGNVHEANINKAAEAGLTLGAGSEEGQTTFEPKNPVRRDQMGSFLARLLNRFVAEGHASTPNGS